MTLRPCAPEGTPATRAATTAHPPSCWTVGTRSTEARSAAAPCAAVRCGAAACLSTLRCARHCRRGGRLCLQCGQSKHHRARAVHRRALCCPVRGGGGGARQDEEVLHCLLRGPCREVPRTQRFLEVRSACCCCLLGSAKPASRLLFFVIGPNSAEQRRTARAGANGKI